MDSKLTLKLDKTVIEQAKKYAASQNRSLSRMIESYLRSLSVKSDQEIEITPLVKSLSGVIKIDEGFDYKKEYGNYLLDKYK